ncbi:MAG: peptidyl-prolyl cis-trans isomerase [Proteobacteria bacterium]|nr:peptidyl-prolyl cis-trans isomerase [Pseudomonadota bacterium]NBP13844.1 peptidyl-prolyl cis-trans isomerase [bacterium]
MKIMYKVVVLAVFFCNILVGKSEKNSAKKVVVDTAIDKKGAVNTAPEKKVDNVKQPELTTVNKIAFIIYTDTDPIIITQLDIERKSLDGRARTSDEVLLERILYYEATVAYRIPVPDDLVDKHIASIKEAHGLSEGQIADLFKKEGYTFEEGKEQLRMSYAISHLEQQFIAGRLVVTEKEIQEFYDKHPIKEPAAVRIKKGMLKKDELTEQEFEQLIKSGLHQQRIEWGNPYWLQEHEIADSRKFIMDMQPGTIKVISSADGYEVITVLKRVQEHNKTLDACRKEIADQIRFPKYQKMLYEFHKSVLDKYEIVDMN